MKKNAALVDALAQTKEGDAAVLLNFNIGKNFGHACNFVKVENGRVYFRNPDPGTVTRVPGARIEDRKTGLQSMTMDDFKRNCDSIAASVS